MSGQNGSTTLTKEQQDWFVAKHGVRYVAVQTNADQPSRALRRAARRKR
jgi:hypothetical protein